MSETTPEKRIRLDLWLKISRITKTRSIALKACEEGKVKVNGVKAKASRIIKVGDEITIKMKNQYRTFNVLDISQKPVSNQDAKFLYNENEPEVSEDSKELYELLLDWHEEGKRKYKGRPTKKERRDMDKYSDY